MSHTLKFLLAIFSFFFFENVKAQCVQVLSDEPLEVCSGGGTIVNLEIDGAFLTVKWTPNIGLDNPNILNPTFNNPIDTTYQLTFKGLDKETQDTCETVAFIDIKTAQFDLILPKDTVKLPCGDTIALPAQVLPSESYFLTEWKSKEGNFTQSNQTISPFIDAIGVYEVSVIGTLGRIVCQAKDSLEVIYSDDNPLVIIPPEKLHCNQASVTLSVANVDTTNSFLYKWTTLDGNFASQTDQAIVVADKVGTYEVTRTDIFGNCEVTQSEQLEVEELSDFNFLITEPNCENPSGTILITDVIGGVGPYQFSIDNGDNFQNVTAFSNLLPENYSIVLQDSNGCQLNKMASIPAFPSFEMSLISKKEIERGVDFSLPLIIENQVVGIESIVWEPAFGLSCTDCLNPLVTHFRNTSFTVVVKGENGCVKEATIDLVISKSSLFYAPTIFSPNADGNNDQFTIYVNPKIAKELTELAIYDRYGNLVYIKTGTSIDTDYGWNGIYKGREMPIGAYLYSGKILLLDGSSESINGTINLFR